MWATLTEVNIAEAATTDLPTDAVLVADAEILPEASATAIPTPGPGKRAYHGRHVDRGWRAVQPCWCALLVQRCRTGPAKWARLLDTGRSSRRFDQTGLWTERGLGGRAEWLMAAGRWILGCWTGCESGKEKKKEGREGERWERETRAVRAGRRILPPPFLHSSSASTHTQCHTYPSIPYMLPHQCPPVSTSVHLCPPVSTSVRLCPPLSTLAVLHRPAARAEVSG